MYEKVRATAPVAMSVESRRQVLQVFGRLLRVQRKTFAGDAVLVNAAKSRTREEFLKSTTSLMEDPEAMKKRLDEAKEVCELLEHNVIQAELISPNSVKPVYRLNFRPEIEINDGHIKGRTGKCC